jgi:hypothetical protein
MSHEPHYSETCQCRSCNAVRADARRVELLERDVEVRKTYAAGLAAIQEEHERIAQLLAHQQATGAEPEPGQEEWETSS